MKRWLKYGWVLLVSVLFLAACGNGGNQSADNGGNESADNSASEPAQEEEAASEPIEITFWHAMNGDQEKALIELTDKFNESQDKVKVKLENQGDYGTLTQKVTAAGASNSLPTLAQATQSNIPDWTGNDLIVPLDDLLTDENGFDEAKLDDIFEGFLNSVTYQGEIRALPFSKSVRVMYVNNDILDKYGVDVPKTWDDIKALGEKIQAEGGEEKAFGLENFIDIEVQTAAMQNGAEWISKDLSTVDLGEDNAVAPVQFVVDGLDAGWARLAGEDNYITNPFGRGEIAVAIGSSAGLSYIKPLAEENNVNWSVAELPVWGDNDPLTILAGNDLVIFKSASEDEQKAAVQYMNFLLEPENTATWALKTGYNPITQAGLDTETYQNFLKDEPTSAASAAEVKYADGQALFVGSGEYRDAWKEAQDKIINEHADVKATLQELQETVKGIIEDNN